LRRWTQTDDPGLLSSGDISAQMSSLAAAAMTFVAAVVLSLALAATRTAETWQTSVGAGLTVEIPHGTAESRTEAVIAALADLEGIESVGVITAEQQRELLAPWIGENLELAALRLPILIDVVGDTDADLAAAAVAAVAPQARITSHAAWREPVLRAASRIRVVALAALFMTVLVACSVVWLAVSASVAAAGRTVEVLRLVGASDAFVISRFARPFAVRAGIGSAAGAALAILALILVRLSGRVGPVTPGPVAYEWLWILLIPVVCAALAWGAARLAVARSLKLTL
jgi:cell division transport system permease protein